MSANKHTPGPWILATSNSWRRFVAPGMASVCEPITQNDGHPDLHFRNGGADGPDARLIAAAPELLAKLNDLLEAVETMQGTYGCVRGDTPEDSDTFTHDEWAEKFLQERASEARAAIAKATVQS